MAGELRIGNPASVGTPTDPDHATPLSLVENVMPPVGGTIGQILSKASGTDHDMAWATFSGSGLGGFVDCSAMTTAAAINAASLAAPDGSIIWLGNRPESSPLLITEPIILRPSQKLMGAGGRQKLTVIRCDTGFTAGQPALAAQGYMNNTTSADSPISVVGIHIDLNGKTGSHGLVVYNFWSHFRDIQIEGADGSAAHCIHQTDKGIDGVTVSTNSHSENTFELIRCLTATNGAHGFWAENTNGLFNSNMDGRLLESFFASIDGIGIRITRAPGWEIINNHLYGIGEHAIRLANCYATIVANNYIEGFGAKDAASQTYDGISLESLLNARASVVIGNTVSTLQPSTPTATRFRCYFARPGTSQTRANLVVCGNTAVFASGTQPAVAKSVPFVFGVSGDSARNMYVEYVGNQIEQGGWWEFPTGIVESTVTVNQGITTGHANISGGYAPLDSALKIASARMARVASTVRTVTFATPTITIDSSVDGNNINITATGNTDIAAPTNGVDGQALQIAILASGGARTITINAAILRLTGITASYIPASTKVLRLSLRYSSLVSAWICEAAGITQ